MTVVQGETSDSGISPETAERPAQRARLLRGSLRARRRLKRAFTRPVFTLRWYPYGTPVIRWADLAGLTALPAILLTLLVALLDPFDLTEKTQLESDAFFYQIIRPDYPDTQRDNITVILMTDDDLAAFAEESPEMGIWPPPYSVYARMLEVILDFQPKAVFIDVGFLTRRNAPGYDRLQTVLADYDSYHDTPVPIFLSGGEKAEGQDKTVIFDLPGPSAGEVSVTYNPAYYPLYDSRNGRLSAACALFRGGVAAGQPVSAAGPCIANDDPNQRMSIVWPPRGGSTQGAGIFACRDLPDSRALRIAGAFLGMAGLDFAGIAPRTENGGSPYRQICPPHVTLAAGDLHKQGGDVLERHLEDKYILIGSSFAMADDLVALPAHRPLPGVFWHAMALDNLLVYGDGDGGSRYVRHDSGTLFGPVTSSLATNIVALIIVQILTSIFLRTLDATRLSFPAGAGAWRILVRTGGWLIFVVLAILAGLTAIWAAKIGIALFAFEQLKLAPINLWGIFTASAARTIIHLPKSLAAMGGLVLLRYLARRGSSRLPA
ncbi:CHASE2 domain-containing protein [Oceanibaculum nanhaiense]|uniref:CHASE2 domain-containing protein n=1 Tax=Oceanibaculum nanhaiense TaxID=1909734 RepID=UPI003F6ED0F1